ncbi:MAG: hypothetical protein QMC37_07660, partial [Flavobacteriales bacterium]
MSSIKARKDDEDDKKEEEEEEEETSKLLNAMATERRNKKLGFSPGYVPAGGGKGGDGVSSSSSLWVNFKDLPSYISKLIGQGVFV